MHDSSFRSDLASLPPRGVASFAGAPFVTPGDPVGADVIVLGVPWDGGTGLRGGARHGPRAIRETSLRFPLWSDGAPAGYWDLVAERYQLQAITVVDGGDVAVVRASQERTDAAITAAARAARQSGKLLLTIGGDHSLTFPILRAFDDLPGLGIIQLDAHLDFSDEAGGVRYNSSTSLRRAGELPSIGPMATLGLRGLRTNPEAFAAARRRGNVLITRETMRHASIDSIVDRLPKAEHVYLTIDLDVLDPAIAPGVSAPELDGLSYDELRQIVRGVARRYHVVGIDIVETSPPHDPAGTTALAATQIAIEALAAVFLARESQ